MLILRLARGITSHFPARASEWALAVIMINLGLLLAVPGESLSSPGHQLLLDIAPEGWWAASCITFGMARLAVLTINGVLPISPHVRVVFSFMAGMFWLHVSFSLALGGVVNFGLATAPVFVGLEFWNGLRASGDASDIDTMRRKRRQIEHPHTSSNQDANNV